MKKQSNYTVGKLTTRVGLDGKWVGANRGTSYFFFSVDPGEHRLCSEWQSIFKTFSTLGAAMGFTAEGGKTYYFRTEVEHREEHAPGEKLEPIDSTEGEFFNIWRSTEHVACEGEYAVSGTERNFVKLRNSGQERPSSRVDHSHAGY